MTHKQLDNYLLSKPGTRLEFPFGEDIAVYKVADGMYALINIASQPCRISLKCDPLLAETLRKKYESVMPGDNLNKRRWNTIIMSGQLSQDEVFSLIDHSYQLVTEQLPATMLTKLSKERKK